MVIKSENIGIMLTYSITSINYYCVWFFTVVVVSRFGGQAVLKKKQVSKDRGRKSNINQKPNSK